MTVTPAAARTVAPAGTAAPARPVLRRVPVPDCQPPYDDELAGRRPGRAGWPTDDGCAVQGTLALAFVLPSGLPAAPEPPAGLRLLPAALPHQAEAGDARAADLDVDFGPQPTGRSALPDPRPWAGRFVQAVVEVLAGDRPLAQLVRWTSEEVYDGLAAHVVTLVRTADGRPLPRGTVRTMRVTEPGDGVAEVSATVRRGPRTTAVALRLEGLDGRWQCTALEIG